jgi:hypothetical protein
MATGPGPRQTAFSRIIRIAFQKLAGGLIMFSWKTATGIEEPNRGNLPNPPEPLGLEFDFSNSTVSNISPIKFNIQTGRWDIVPSELPTTIKNEAIPIENPITAKMLTKYATFTLFPSTSQLVQQTDPGIETWTIVKTSWNLIYNHSMTSRVTPWNWTRDQAIAYYEATTVPNEFGVKIIGVQNAPVFVGGVPIDPPVPPSAEGWAYWNQIMAMGAEGYLEPGAPITRYGRRGRAYLMMNLALIKLLMPKARRKDASFRFRINLVPNGTSALLIERSKFELRADVYAAGKETDFSLDGDGWPRNVKADQKYREDAAAVNRGYYDVTVFFQTKDAQKRVVPPRIEIESNFFAGPGEG